MEAKVISQTKRTAKETIKCNACAYLNLRLTQSKFKELTKSEQKAVLSAQKNNWSIIKGGQYIEEHGEYNGKPYQSNYLLKIHEINCKYGFYDSFKNNTTLA